MFGTFLITPETKSLKREICFIPRYKLHAVMQNGEISICCISENGFCALYSGEKCEVPFAQCFRCFERSLGLGSWIFPNFGKRCYHLRKTSPVAMSHGAIWFCHIMIHQIQICGVTACHCCRILSSYCVRRHKFYAEWSVFSEIVYSLKIMKTWK